MKNLGEPCVLEDRTCIQCGDCDLCDLDPTKPCNNCCHCIETPDGDFAEIGIDDILLNVEDTKPSVSRPKESPTNKYKLKS